MKNKENYFKIKIPNIMNILLIVISIIILFICLINCDSLPSHSRAIIILPFVYVICLIILEISRKKGPIDFIQFMIMAFYSVQYLIFPLYTFCSGMIDLSEYNTDINQHITDAVLLQSFVLICITLYLILSKDKVKVDTISNLSKNFISSKIARRLVLLLILVSACLLVKYPQFLLKFRLIFYNNDSDTYYSFLEASKTVRAGMPDLVYVLGLWILQITKLLIVYYLIIFIWNLSKGKNEYFYIIVSAVIVGCSCLITTEDKAVTIFSAISIILLMLKLYPKRIKFILSILGVSLFCFIFVGFIIIPMLGANSSGTVAYKLNAYFSGTINVAGGFLMEGNNKINTFLGDIFRSIPMVNHFFVDFPMSYIEFNRALGYDAVYNSQIIPMISQGYYYFNIVGAVIFPITLIYFIKRFFNKMIISTSTYEFYNYAMLFVFSFMGLFLYDLALTFAQILNYCMPIYLVYIASKRGGEK